MRPEGRRNSASSPLVLPVRGAGQGDDAAADLRVHGHRHQAVGHAGLQHIAAYFARLSTFGSRESFAATST